MNNVVVLFRAAWCLPRCRCMVGADMTSDLSSNPFWDYSLATYGRPQVAEICLALQDNFEIDVNFLLYALWLGSGGYELTETHLSALEGEVARWRAEVLKPLRALRRQLPVDGPGAAIRDEIRAIELRAERRQQDLMYLYRESAELESTTGALPIVNLERVAALFAGDIGPCKALLQRLTELLET